MLWMDGQRENSLAPHSPDYGNCRNLIYFGADMLSWLLPFTVLPRA